MATMDSTWLANPQDSDTPSFGDDEIRGTRLEFHDRLTKEHVIGGTTVADGAHKEGSARAYYQATEPSLRPDGSSSLDTSDDGRLYVDSDDDALYTWDGSAWASTAVGHAATADLATLATLATDATDATTANQVTDQGGGNDLLLKIIDIGDWNMNSTTTVSKAHGVTLTKIRSVTSLIQDDSGLTLTPAAKFDSTIGGIGYYVYVNNTTVSVTRRTGSVYEVSPNYNAVSPEISTRGWMMIWYIA